jgi:hypothetical protein
VHILRLAGKASTRRRPVNSTFSVTKSFTLTVSGHANIRWCATSLSTSIHVS